MNDPRRRLAPAPSHPVLPAPLVGIVAMVVAISCVTGCGSAGVGSPAGSGGDSASGGRSPGSGGASTTGGGGAPVGTGGAPATAGASGSAGNVGSGGAPASGGNGGNAPRGGNGGGNSGEGGRASGVMPFFTDDFEAGTVGRQPSGWDNFIAYVKNATNPQGATLALVDDSQKHGGAKSIHFHGGGSPAMLTRPLPPGTNKLYVRAFFYLSRQLGMNPGANHETLLGIRKSIGAANDEVRFGEIKGVIGTNEVPTDNISPKMAQWGMGPVVAANRWACIEVAFLADQPQHILQAWADGVMVHSITGPDQWQNGVMPMNWMAGKFVEFIVGWQSFSNANADVWMDDLVLSTGPIGCN